MKIISLQSCGSSQKEAKKLISQNPDEIFVVLTDEQKSGKGQHGKSWASPANAGLYFSLAYPCQINPGLLNKPEILTYAAALATRETLSELLQELLENHDFKSKLQLKAINDVYYDGCKLAGILVENFQDTLIVGIGINLSDTKRTIKEEIIAEPKAAPISIEEIYHQSQDSHIKALLESQEFRTQLAQNLALQVQHWLEIALAGKDEIIRENFEKHCISGL